MRRWTGTVNDLIDDFPEPIAPQSGKRLGAHAHVAFLARGAHDGAG